MFKPRNINDRRIFFPWEGRGGLRRFLALGRVGPVLVLTMVLSFIWWVAQRERHAAGVRKTRVALSTMRAPVERYLLENEGECPQSLDQVLRHSDREAVPRDAWGRPIRLVCPGGREGMPYVLMSDGPDGVPGGLDRIEY